MDDDLSARRSSFGRDVDAGAYARTRPGYPAEAVRPALGDAARRVLDLGAGTGALTAALVGLGHEVLAVDPSAAMLAELAQRVPGAEVAVGTGEALPAPDASVDAVTCAQAWHWVDVTATTAEVLRVLRPDGVLVLVWNVLDAEVPWVAELDGLTSSSMAGTVDGTAEIAVVGTGLAEAGRTVTPNPVRAPDAAAVAALAATWSAVAVRPDRSEVLRAVERLAAAHAEPDGSVLLPYRTASFWFRRS